MLIKCMAEAYIVDAVRTAVGNRRRLRRRTSRRHAAHVIKTVVARHDIDPAAIDDVILGCLDNIALRPATIARTAALAAGLPESVPGATSIVMRFRQQAVHSPPSGDDGTSDLIVAGGVQEDEPVPDP